MNQIELELYDEHIYRGELEILGRVFEATAIPLVPGAGSHFEAADDRNTYALHNFVTYFEKANFTSPDRVTFVDTDRAPDTPPRWTLQCVMFILPKAIP